MKRTESQDSWSRVRLQVVNDGDRFSKTSGFSRRNHHERLNLASKRFVRPRRGVSRAKATLTNGRRSGGTKRRGGETRRGDEVETYFTWKAVRQFWSISAWDVGQGSREAEHVEKRVEPNGQRKPSRVTKRRAFIFYFLRSAKPSKASFSPIHLVALFTPKLRHGTEGGPEPIIRFVLAAVLLLLYVYTRSYNSYVPELQSCT